jgi:hypothetical protein
VDFARIEVQGRTDGRIKKFQRLLFINQVGNSDLSRVPSKGLAFLSGGDVAANGQPQFWPGDK